MVSPNEYSGCLIGPFDQTRYDGGGIRPTIYVIPQVDLYISLGPGVSFILIDELVRLIKQVRAPVDITNGIDGEPIWHWWVAVPLWLSETRYSMFACVL